MSKDKKYRILVIEDEGEVAELLRTRLASVGYEVILSDNGYDAINIAKKEMPDLILLDLMLPKIDGYTICRMLKFDKKYKNTDMR